VEEVNAVILDHNATTTNLDTLKTAAIEKIKSHYLSTIFDEVAALDASVSKLGGEIVVLDSEIKTVREEIDADMAQVSSSHKACEIINGKLKSFLGHQELMFVPESKREKTRMAPKKK
jgi:uncharacterized protein YoxC